MKNILISFVLLLAGLSVSPRAFSQAGGQQMNGKTPILEQIAALLAGFSKQGNGVKSSSADSSFLITQNEIVSFLECLECDAAHYSDPAGSYESHIPYLISVLQTGPSLSRQEAYKEKLKISFREVSDYLVRENKDPLPWNRERYVEYYKKGYVEQYQLNALKALQVLGSRNDHNYRQLVCKGLQDSDSGAYFSESPYLAGEVKATIDALNCR